MEILFSQFAWTLDKQTSGWQWDGASFHPAAAYLSILCTGDDYTETVNVFRGQEGVEVVANWNGKWKKAAEPPTIREEKRKGDAFRMTGEVTLKSRYSNQMKG